MTPFQTYCRYVAIKNHFTNKNYDCVKYNYKVRASKSAFEKRNDKMFFYKLSKHDHIDEFFISLFIRNPELWVGDIVQNYSMAESIYKDWCKRTQALSYTFKEDIKKLKFPEDLKATKHEHPVLLRRMLRGETSVETVVILDQLLGLCDRWRKKLDGDIIFEQYELIIKKYASFLTIGKKDYKMILKSILEKQNET